MLSGNEIKRQLEAGNLYINPFDDRQLNPNSYNCRLGRDIIWLDEVTLDLHKKPRIQCATIGPEGFYLRKGNVYLASTIEVIASNKFIPCIDGRSTIGRYGIAVHITAGFGDVGFFGNLTCELEARHRDTLIHYGDLIAQISFHPVQGEITMYSGSYQNQVGPREPNQLKGWTDDERLFFEKKQ